MEDGMSGRHDDSAAERLAAAIGQAREQWPAAAALERVKRGVATAVAGSTPGVGPTQARLLRRSTRAAWLRGGSVALLLGAGFGAWRLTAGDGDVEAAAVHAQPVGPSTVGAPAMMAATAVPAVPVLPPAVELAQPVAPGPPSAETRRKPQRARPARPAPQEAASDRPASALDPETELALLRRALGALPAHPNESLELAAQHERDYAQGIFGQEREVIAIDALVALQRTSAAEARARRFLARYPRSAHAPRIRALLGEEEQAPSRASAPSNNDSAAPAGRALAKAAQGAP
jgi:hypothetical protein